MNVDTWIRREILEQQGYQVDPQDCPIKLDAMENPHVLPLSLYSALYERFKAVLLNRYPEAGARHLRSRYAQHFGVDEDMLMIGNGSDELITVLCSAMSNRGTSILIPMPTFAVYRMVALNNGRNVSAVPLDENFDLDLSAMLDVIKREQPALVFLSNPNNPTGNCFDPQKMEAVIRASSGIVVVDEAYFYYSGKTFLPLLKTYENLVILRTLSKVGLAAIRVGFLIGSPLLVRALDKVRLPYNINSYSQVVAAFYLDEEKAFLDQVQKIIRSREELYVKMRRIKGIRPYHSQANFIFFSCTSDTDSIYGHLLKRGILIKNLNAPGRMKNCMRVTVGNDEENVRFIAALQGCLTL